MNTSSLQAQKGMLHNATMPTGLLIKAELFC